MHIRDLETANWYVLRTIPGKEQEAAELMERTIDHRLWRQCRILKKQKLFRVEGRLFLNREDMFPGYMFIETEEPERLERELEKSREYPKLISDGGKLIVPVEEKDLGFLKIVCGEDLQEEMSLSKVETDEEGNLTHIEGILKSYEDHIVRKRLRKRYVLAQVDLFQRKENILFGIYLPGDKIWQNRR